MIELNNLQIRIAKYIMAKQFRFLKYQNQIYLYNDLQDCSLVYIIKKEYNLYTVYKLKPLDIILDIINTDKGIVLKAMIERPWNFIQLQQLMEEVIQLNLQQLYFYMVQQENMNKQDFNLYFQCNLSLTYKTININNIIIDYHISINNNIINRIISKLEQYIKLYPKIFNMKIYICIKDKIINHDGKITNGNNILNKENYDIAICIDSTDPIYVISHQIGHSFQDIYLEKSYVDKIFDLNKKEHLFIHRQTLYKNRQQFIPQLFAAYHCNELDKNTKENFQKYILNNAK